MSADAMAMLPRLRSLVAGLAPPGPISVVIGSMTAYLPQLGQIMIARDLLEHDPDAVLGGAAHELGHVLATRYHIVRSDAGRRERLWRFALNAAEDPRVHAFLLDRTPGVRPWLRALFAHDPPPGPGSIQSELHGFLMAMAGCDRGELPFLQSLPQAKAAFERTRKPRQTYVHTLPPADFALQSNGLELYFREVQPLLAPTAPPLPRPADREISIRLSAAAALMVFRREIWPVVLELAEQDAHRAGAVLDRDPGLRARAEAAASRSEEAARLAAEVMAQTAPHDPGGRPPFAETVKLARKLLETLWETEDKRRTGVGSGEDSDMLPSGTHAPPGERGKARVRRPPDPVEPEDLASQIAGLERSLKRLLPRRQPSWSRGFPSGSRLDVPRAMLASATGHHFDAIWQRRSPPKQVRFAVLLLVDCSGSMSGPCIAAATAGTHLFAAALDRIREADWAVYGFQDELIPVIRHGERLSDAGRTRIAALPREVAGDNPGGHNEPSYNDDGPVLREAATILAARPATDRLLLVISDGGPSGRRSSPADLHAAVAEVSALPGMTLIGLGLGRAGTEAVAKYYPRSEVNVAPQDLSVTVARLLNSAFRGAVRG